MTNFVKYNSIENSYRKKTINKYIESGITSGEWCVTEKIHGSNFAFYIEKEDEQTVIKCAKRSCIIGGNDIFFNHNVVLEKYRENLIQLFDTYTTRHPSVKEMSVHGELFGGSFSGMKSEYKSIQKGVEYTPDIEFCAFDLKANGKFMNYDKAINLFLKFGIFHATMLFVGTFEECLNYNTKFNSTIPKLLGLEEYRDTPNICEGIVIKPIITKYANTGERAILKKKNEQFSEKSTAPKQKKQEVELGDIAKKALDEISSYITENRLRNVISKEGTFSEKDFGKLMGLYTKDVFGEYFKDHNFEGIEKQEQKVITKKVSTQSATLIRKNFLDIIDGEF